MLQKIKLLYYINHTKYKQNTEKIWLLTSISTIYYILCTISTFILHTCRPILFWTIAFCFSSFQSMWRITLCHFIRNPTIFNFLCLNKINKMFPSIHKFKTISFIYRLWCLLFSFLTFLASWCLSFFWFFDLIF